MKWFKSKKSDSIRLSQKYLEINIKDAPTSDRVILKIYSSKLILNLLEQMMDPLFVEEHRPFTSALIDLLLYTLNGCIDASLQDIREGLGLTIKPYEVRISRNSKFMKELKSSMDPRAKKDVTWIHEMQTNVESWLYKLRSYRNRSTHQDPIGWALFRPIKMPGLVNSDKDFHSYFRESFELVKQHCCEIRKRYGKYESYPFLDF